MITQKLESIMIFCCQMSQRWRRKGQRIFRVSSSFLESAMAGGVPEAPGNGWPSLHQDYCQLSRRQLLEDTIDSGLTVDWQRRCTFIQCFSAGGWKVIKWRKVTTEKSRTIERLRLEWALKIIYFQSPAMGRDATSQLRVHRVPFNLALNAFRDSAPTASLGRLCQCFIALWVKNVFLTANLNLPSFSLKPFCLILSLSNCVKRQSSSCL